MARIGWRAAGNSATNPAPSVIPVNINDDPGSMELRCSGHPGFYVNLDEISMLDPQLQNLIETLPDADKAKLFYNNLSEKHPAKTKKLLKKQGLLSDLLALAAYSPLLSTTILQNPEYIAWLDKARQFSDVRSKEDTLESLARFALTNSQLDTNVLLARFRRRELLRIYLKDLRNLVTIAEITEDISNLADAILEFALQKARQKLDNLYGIPLEIDEKGRPTPAGFCIVSLGKLGSRELNYASDIDLLFIYSAEGNTSGQGERGAVTNREYFVKLAENIFQLVGGQSGEGAAYRVDTRLRPHGRVGALSISLAEAVNYYKISARAWERQVLIRSRASAGNEEIFKVFFSRVESNVFSENETVENALENVRLSKEKINLEKSGKSGFNVKLGRGGIREIEFIAQALQLAYGGNDEWLRVSHTLKSLVRLSDRKVLTENELTELVEAYKFLRRLEHRLQMENGLQTHRVPENPDKLLIIAQRMGFSSVADFKRQLEHHTDNVKRIFNRIFSETEIFENKRNPETIAAVSEEIDSGLAPIFTSLEKSEKHIELNDDKLETLERVIRISPHFAEIITANPELIEKLPSPSSKFEIDRNYREEMTAAIPFESSFAAQLAALRNIWSVFLLEIVVFDVFRKLSLKDIKRAQTKLAEASIETALAITKKDLANRFSVNFNNYGFAVLGLGKLGGRGMDYDSDLDLILIYDDEKAAPVDDLTHAEFYSRAVVVFVNTLSAITRDGSLYRVDLRLRPDGKNGATVSGKNVFLTYLENRAAVWEWLAYVKLRAAAGDADLVETVENKARQIIHQKAQKIDVSELINETRRVRDLLEEQKSASRKGKEIDIKYGEGGMLDVYFAIRYLQLREDIPDDPENRSTVFSLNKLLENDSLSGEDFRNFSEGYEFLSELDHNLRLTVGRSTRLPVSNRTTLKIIAERMNFDSFQKLLETLTIHRLNIRHSFENVFKTQV